MLSPAILYVRTGMQAPTQRTHSIFNRPDRGSLATCMLGMQQAQAQLGSKPRNKYLLTAWSDLDGHHAELSLQAMLPDLAFKTSRVV